MKTTLYTSAICLGLASFTYSGTGRAQTCSVNQTCGTSSIDSSADAATMSGGRNQTIGNTLSATIGGGLSNQIDDGADYSTISGGTQNHISNTGGTIGGGKDNIVLDNYGTVGGGYGNEARRAYDVVAGGFGNWAWDSDYATLGGGESNFIRNSD